MKLTHRLKLSLNRFKPKGVGYNAFMSFQEMLKTKATPEEVISTVILNFYPRDNRSIECCLNEFNDKCVKEVNYWLPKFIDFEKNTAQYLILADLYFVRKDFVGLYNHLFEKNRKDIPIKLAEQTAKLFLTSTKDFGERYEWIYNPPALPGTGKATIGAEYRREFSEKYGAYSEIMYLISMGDPMKNEAIEQMRCDKFLSIGEYLVHKKSIEVIS